MNTKSHSQILALLGTVFFAFVPLITFRYDPNSYIGGRSRDAAERERRNSSAFAAMLGEFRTSIGDLLFVKTERYLDSGIAYEPHLDETQYASDTEDLDEEHDEHGQEHDEHGEAEHTEIASTLIRTPDRDFRGFIGDLHRTIKPWRDPREQHQHEEGKELLPWLRVVTVADPQYIRAYMAGGWWLKQYDLDQAEVFLKEGIRKNPDGFQLYLMLAQVYYRRAVVLSEELGTKDDDRVREWYFKARDQYYEAAEIALKQRPKDWVYTEEWSEEWIDFKEEDLKAAMHMGVLIDYRYGKLDDAISHAQRFLGVIGENPVLERNLEKMLAERQARE